VLVFWSTVPWLDMVRSSIDTWISLLHRTGHAKHPPRSTSMVSFIFSPEIFSAPSKALVWKESRASASTVFFLVVRARVHQLVGWRQRAFLVELGAGRRPLAAGHARRSDRQRMRLESQRDVLLLFADCRRRAAGRQVGRVPRSARRNVLPSGVPGLQRRPPGEGD
jgi:hypothetical protein